MMKPIPPADDFWQRLLEEVEKTTEEEWTRFFEEYEKERKPMEDTKDLCNQILQLIEDLNEPSFLRFDDITIVNEFGSYDCYGDKCSDMYIKIYQEEKFVLFIDKTTYYGVQYEVANREIDKISFLQHIVELLKLRLERNKHE